MDDETVAEVAMQLSGKPLSGKGRAMLERLKNMPDSEIDYSDIPKPTDERLCQFRRSPKVLVAARLDREVYDWLQKFGAGYSTRINRILRAVMVKQRRALPL